MFESIALNAQTAAAGRPALSKQDAQAALMGMLGMAAIIVRYTANTRDDQVVDLLTGVVLDPVQFAKLYEIFYPTKVS